MYALTTRVLQDEIAKLPDTRGSMLVVPLLGADKTTVSVATGHQEYHPLYVSVGNITNEMRRAHGQGVIPLAFLPIPKSESPVVPPALSPITYTSH